MDAGAVPDLAGTPAIAGRSSARPFVGRAQELADLAAALEDAAAGRGSLVLLAGEPGIGKTRLMSELGHVAAQRDVVGHKQWHCWSHNGRRSSIIPEGRPRRAAGRVYAPSISRKR